MQDNGVLFKNYFLDWRRPGLITWTMTGGLKWTNEFARILY